MPIGCFAVHQNNQLWLRGLVADPDGSKVIYDEMTGAAADGEKMGVELAEKLLAAGADKILKAVYDNQ